MKKVEGIRENWNGGAEERTNERAFVVISFFNFSLSFETMSLDGAEKQIES